MKAKTIKAVLAKKHNDFVASIDDQEVRDLVDQNSIITGGCIVSMLLDEKINDFDYYFTDKETTWRVAQYFVGKFNEGHGENISIKDEDGRIRIYIKSKGVAGQMEGEPDDGEPTVAFDDLGMEELPLDRLKEVQEQEKPRYQPIFLSANAIALTGKIQLVVRFYGNPEQIHENYDFAHCTCYWTSKDKELVLPAAALEAILTRELIYTGSKYPLCSIIRTRKFIKRGWHINAGQYLKMALHLNELALLDLKTLEDQTTGVDSAYFAQVIEYFKNKQAEGEEVNLNNTYLFEIINRIF